jgi:hypothetical protein
MPGTARFGCRCRVNRIVTHRGLAQRAEQLTSGACEACLRHGRLPLIYGSTDFVILPLVSYDRRQRGNHKHWRQIMSPCSGGPPLKGMISGL